MALGIGARINTIFDYTLSFRSPPINNKADKGTVVHKALELLAHKKLCLQNGLTEFADDELGSFKIKQINPEFAITTAYNYFSKKTVSCGCCNNQTQFVWTNKDFIDCKIWMHEALSMNSGMFNPLNRTIVKPEQYFDFEIREPWAQYSYNLDNGTKLEGYLAVKGTVDLLTKLEDGVYELIDWKTGERKDWNSKSPDDKKGYEKFIIDSQLRLYHYALSRLYPDIKQFIITIVYVRDGGPFSLCFDEQDLTKTLAMLKKRFQVIKNTVKPKRIWPHFKCTRMCHYGKNNQAGTNQTICEFYKDKIVQLGIDKVTTTYSRDKTYGLYGSGGGRYEANFKES